MQFLIINSWKFNFFSKILQFSVRQSRKQDELTKVLDIQFHKIHFLMKSCLKYDICLNNFAHTPVHLQSSLHLFKKKVSCQRFNLAILYQNKTTALV